MKRLTAVLGMLMASTLLASPPGPTKSHKSSHGSSHGSSHMAKHDSHKHGSPTTYHEPSTGKSDSFSSMGSNFSSSKPLASPSPEKHGYKPPHH